MEKKECENCRKDISRDYPKNGVVEASVLKECADILVSFCSKKCFEEFESERQDECVNCKKLLIERLTRINGKPIHVYVHLDAPSECTFPELSLLEHSDDGGKT